MISAIAIALTFAVASAALAIALSVSREARELRSLTQQATFMPGLGMPTEPSRLKTGDKILLPELVDTADESSDPNTSERVVGVFTLGCQACEVLLPEFLDLLDRDDSILPIIDGPRSEAERVFGPTAAHPSLQFATRPGAVVEALQLMAFPSFIQTDVNGDLLDQDLYFERLLT